MNGPVQFSEVPIGALITTYSDNWNPTWIKINNQKQYNSRATEEDMYEPGQIGTFFENNIVYWKYDEEVVP